MKKLIVVFYIIYGISLSAGAQSFYDNAPEHQCLKCHGFQTFTFHNELMDTETKRLMNPYYVMDTVAMKNAVHKTFDCTDCHSYDYTTYPHPSNLKLEPLASCLDCHGGDETFASYQFETIDEEFKKSVHYEVYGDHFTCSKCHNQHTYTATARNSTDVLEIVRYSNNLCMSCHNDMKKYSLVSGHENPQLVTVHDWLPNQELHFKHVRCIECHTEVVDGLMVSHNIRGKKEAVKNCVECHSTDSRLKASLYKYQNLQQRSENGNINTVISNSSYVIGTMQVPGLKTLSLIIFLATIGGVAVHVFFRIRKSK